MMSDQNTTKERYAILLPPHITQAKAERLAKWVTWQVDPHGDEENAGLIELPSGDRPTCWVNPNTGAFFEATGHEGVTVITLAWCSCGEPWTLGVVHRPNKPCYIGDALLNELADQGDSE